MFGLKKRIEDLERKIRVLEFKEKAKGQKYLLECGLNAWYVSFIMDNDVVEHYICHRQFMSIHNWYEFDVELKDNYLFVYLKEICLDEENKTLEKVFKITSEKLIPVDLDLIEKLIK